MVYDIIVGALGSLVASHIEKYTWKRPVAIIKRVLVFLMKLYAWLCTAFVSAAVISGLFYGIFELDETNGHIIIFGFNFYLFEFFVMFLFILVIVLVILLLYIKKLKSVQPEINQKTVIAERIVQSEIVSVPRMEINENTGNDTFGYHLSLHNFSTESDFIHLKTEVTLGSYRVLEFSKSIPVKHCRNFENIRIEEQLLPNNVTFIKEKFEKLGVNGYRGELSISIANERFYDTKSVMVELVELKRTE